MSDTAAELRAIWNAKGVPVERQNELVRQIAAKGLPSIPDIATMTPAEELTPIGVQLVIPGCERRPGPTTPKQGSLW